MNVALELRRVSYRYAGHARWALRDVDLRVEAGEVVGVVGATAAGKSTLCLVAAGVAPATIGGERRGEVLTAAGPDCAIVFQDPGAQLTGISGSVFEEVAFGPQNLGLTLPEIVARTRASIRAVGIDALAERHPAHLSGGETQLVAIASALALAPRVLVLDEPTAELDDLGAARVADGIRAAAASGVGVLIAEHRTSLLASVCDRVLGLDAGTVAMTGPAPVVLADPNLEELGVPRPPGRTWSLASGPTR